MAILTSVKRYLIIVLLSSNNQWHWASSHGAQLSSPFSMGLNLLFPQDQIYILLPPPTSQSLSLLWVSAGCCLCRFCIMRHVGPWVATVWCACFILSTLFRLLKGQILSATNSPSPETHRAHIQFLVECFVHFPGSSVQPVSLTWLRCFRKVDTAQSAGWNQAGLKIFAGG